MEGVQGQVFAQQGSRQRRGQVEMRNKLQVGFKKALNRQIYGSSHLPLYIIPIKILVQ